MKRAKKRKPRKEKLSAAFFLEYEKLIPRIPSCDNKDLALANSSPGAKLQAVMESVSADISNKESNF